MISPIPGHRLTLPHRFTSPAISSSGISTYRGPQVLSEALGLRVGAGGCRHPITEEPNHYEIERPKVSQLITVNGKTVDFRYELPKLLDAQVGAQPSEAHSVACPDADVGIAALVA